MCQRKSAHAFQQLIERGRVGDELTLVNGYPTAAVLGGVFGKPPEVLRSIGIECAALAHLRWCEERLETQEVLVVRLGDERFLEHTSGVRNPLPF